jgi:hypothetical protein
MLMPKLLIIFAAMLSFMVVYVARIRPWHVRGGATDEEVARALPGDEVTPDARYFANHAVTIEAPASEVWPWLAQIGQDRGGFYSYSWIENLVGCDLRNADVIHPEWQDIKAGDGIWLHPKAPTVRVARVEPGRALVLEGWGAFVIEPIDERSCRLIARSRGKPIIANPVLERVLGYGVFEPAHFIMERKMLLGIKARAEALRHSRERVVPVG